jgi:acyl-CoA thioester hydrolase
MTDQMGVVYYGNYLELFEIGRAELLRSTGLDYRMMERDGYFLPVIHVQCDYLAPARYDDLLIVRTAVTRLSRVRLDFTYEIVREEGDGKEEVADGAVRDPRVPVTRICTGAGGPWRR